jgi:hypothetical protein
MLLPSDLADSELFDRVRKGELPHPTSGGFDAQRWIDAMEQLKDKKPRDMALATSAVHYGIEIASLRAAHAAALVEQMSRSGGLRLLAALANQQYLTLMGKVTAANKARDRDEPLHLEQLDRAPVMNVGGQGMTGDDHATSLVDALPHWLHHIMALPDDAACTTPDKPGQVAAKAIMTCSIERALRDLWMEALWSGHRLTSENGTMLHQPADLPSAERWFIWELRHQALLAQEMFIDMGAHIVAAGQLAPAAPVLERTVRKIYRGRGGKRRFRLGAVTGHKPIDRIRVSEHDALDRLYTGLFLSEPLPALSPHDIDCRLLNRAWWLVADLVRMLGEQAGKPIFNDDRGVGRFAFAIGRDELQELVAEALAIAGERAGAIVDFLTIDPNDGKSLFGRGFWPAPFLPDPARGRLYLLAAPLLVGSPLRRVEAWLERGGLTDRAGLKGRGKPFEDFVRASVRDALAGNALLSDHTVAPHALKRKGSSEEVDLLIRIGGTLLVGEVKCFLSPSEPLERYNYLKNVEGAVLQAKAKADWVDQNRDEVAALVGISDAEAAKALKLVPLVVTNHGLGLGLELDGVTVTDLHYLKLLMGHGQYQGDTMFKRAVGTAHQNVLLYSDQADFEERVAEIFGDPPPLRRYQGKIEWDRVPFATSDNSPFALVLPKLAASPMNASALHSLEQLATEWDLLGN